MKQHTVKEMIFFQITYTKTLLKKSYSQKKMFQLMLLCTCKFNMHQFCSVGEKKNNNNNKYCCFQ
jgi:hypothetical protein